MFLWLWTLIFMDAASITDPYEAPAKTPVIQANSPASPTSPASPASPGPPNSPASPQMQAEPQVPSGRFTTATEVRPILTATKSSWVGVREYDGQDLVYVTQILAWRCGLAGLRVAINDAPLSDWPLPPCHLDTPAPNAILPEDGLPYRAFPLGSVKTITVELIYDDLSSDAAVFLRPMVMIP
ncbi:hypothetical protein [Pseudooceanicola nitratireducens]|uniref:hypothetical protein n=1 Tax=Pseudooceanicola nitratireducens TaxID=517719 RepID=UPI001C947E9C|nr:hypothetical protein [Pseudooceanicola nitratireducens]MBY6157096.1 hypothetical protein [Pseudooceanicola nitratireducens]